jgi:hypothetical protein
MASLVRNFIAGMSARERRLAAAMLLVMVGMGLFLAIYFVRSSIADIESEYEEGADILREVAANEANYLAKQREQSRSKKARGKPIPLRTLVDNVADEIGVTVPDVKEIPDKTHPGNWIEHAVDLSIRSVGLQDMTRFMEAVEDYRRRFPIAITKLKIRKRRGGEDSFDVQEMMISTYEQVAAPADATEQAGAPATGRGGR